MSTLFTSTFPYVYDSPLHPPSYLTSDPDIHSLAYQAALSVLHDHVAMITLNPLVKDHNLESSSTLDEANMPTPDAFPQEVQEEMQLDPSDVEPDPRWFWQIYSITDSLRLLGGLWNTGLTFRGAFRDCPDGLETVISAPGGTTLHGRWKVDWTDDPELWLREGVEVKCWFGTAWYIKRTLAQSHGPLHEAFANLWAERLQQSMQQRRDAPTAQRS